MRCGWVVHVVVVVLCFADIQSRRGYHYEGHGFSCRSRALVFEFLTTLTFRALNGNQHHFKPSWKKINTKNKKSSPTCPSHTLTCRTSSKRVSSAKKRVPVRRNMLLCFERGRCPVDVHVLPICCLFSLPLSHWTDCLVLFCGLGPVVQQGVRVSRSLLTASLFEHLSTGQAIHPRTQTHNTIISFVQSVKSVLS